MTTKLQFIIDSKVSLDDVEETLRLAMLAMEGLYGPARVQLDVQYTFDRDAKDVTINANGEVGDSVVSVFLSLLMREFGADAVTFRRIESRHPALPSEN